jgi:hypothetical protein
MPFLRWSGLPEKMISTRPISKRLTSARLPILRRSRDGTIAYNRMGKLRRRNDQPLATGSLQAIQQGPFSELSYRQAFARA